MSEKAQLHDIDETAEILRVSRVTVYRLIAAGDLESIDAAPTGSRRSKTRVSEEAITRFIEKRTRKPKALRSA